MKTVFSKLMIIIIVIILLSTVLSAVMISQFYSNIYTQNEKEDMFKIAQNISTLAAYNFADKISMQYFLSVVSQVAADNQDVIWVMDSNYKAWAVAPTFQTQITSEEISQYYYDILNSLRQGNPAFQSGSNGLFNTPVLTVAMPVTMNGNVAGAVFVHKKLNDLTNSMMEMYRQIIYSALIAAAIAVILIYFFVRSILKPLKEVTLATKQLAFGNFDVRLKVNSSDEIGELSKTFNSVAEDLGKYENTRRSFVANVSHELRSPLTSMQGLVQGILDGTIKSSQHVKYQNVVLDETKRLNHLINDLLDLSQIESGKVAFQFSNMDVNELIRRCLITFESKISAKNIDVDVEIRDEKQIVYADENRIKQVMMNLIDNAVKFTPDRGKIKIFTSESPDSIFVNVNNSGSLISDEDLPYIFERFYKADKSHTRSQEGTGLGLSIVKKIITEHGQRIWVESTMENGTTFTFSLKKATAK
jgi:signal transduction histidine kinase